MNYHHMPTSFGRNSYKVNSREPLSNDQLRSIVPAIFADDAHHSRSEKYVYVPTIKLVEGLRREGWAPFFAVQAKPRAADKIGHAKHMLRLRRPGDIGSAEAAEVVIVNSHDGSTSYQMFAGMIRFVCTNSMIGGTRFEEVRVPHKGHIQNQIIEGAYTVAQDFPRLMDATDSMKALQLTRDEQRAYASAALVARYGEEVAPVQPEQILRPRRSEDAGNSSLWQTMNTVQENIIRGGLMGRKADDRGLVRRARTRAINGIDQNVTVNRALWTLADEMQRIKSMA